MKVLNDFVVVQKQKEEYQGLLQGIDNDDTIKAKVLGVGDYVEYSSIRPGDIVLLDWKEAKRIKNDLYAIKLEHVVMIVEDIDDQEV